MGKGKLVGKILMIALGAVIICLSVRGLMDVPGYKNAIGSAVYLEEPVVLPENEGKMVIVHGTPEMVRPAYDEELGLTLNAIRAYRYDEEYTKTSGEHKTNIYKWVSRGSKHIAGEAALGEFDLDEKLLAGFPADADYEDFDSAEISANGYSTAYGKTAEGAVTDRVWVIEGGTHYYDVLEQDRSLSTSHFARSAQKDTAEEREGAKAYAYKVYTGNGAETVTIAGIQKGNMLTVHEKMGPVVNEGVLSQEELMNAGTGFLLGGSIAFLVIGIALVFLGLRFGRKNNSKQRKKV